MAYSDFRNTDECESGAKPWVDRLVFHFLIKAEGDIDRIPLGRL
jgi:hypothetical protein